MAILELDVGNTRIKWRCLSCKGEHLDGGSLCHDDTQALDLLRQCGARAKVIRVASVASPEIEVCMTEWWGASPAIDLRFAKAQAKCQGVVNSYADPSSMGVDRWLAIVAAYVRCRGACCIIDCGSAITVDVVAKNGHHAGGFIVPGFNLLKSALLKETKQVNFEPSDLLTSQSLGKNTAEAVNHGLMSMIVAWLNRVVEDFHRCYPASKDNVFITGGDALVIQGCLDLQVEYLPELVLDGLSLVLE